MIVFLWLLVTNQYGCSHSDRMKLRVVIVYYDDFSELAATLEVR